ncbi:MAG: hypothetical protein EZS28_034566 [Streblomastix strix]|uniref:AMP-dependent synthetase/ligase domain-containing protein n=1 Tax=Streblomastix strix TaxID=222440 RepID=A0A5J4UGU1_9EUKA|nr:MAG: hypothetical protein EZS28_034566 [Streblomastix strix]
MLGYKIQFEKIANTQHCTRSKAIGRYIQLKGCKIRYNLAFLGVLLSGAVAVPCFPLYPTHLKRTMTHFRETIEDVKSPIVCTTQQIFGIPKLVVAAIDEFKDIGLLWILIDEIQDEYGKILEDPHLTRDSITFLQCTSISIGIPKRCMLQHGYLINDEKIISEGFACHPEQALLY